MLSSRFNGLPNSSVSSGLGLMHSSSLSGNSLMLPLGNSGNGSNFGSMGASGNCPSPLGMPMSSNNSSASTASGHEDRSRTNLIINYLPQSFDQTDLYNLFETVGPIRQCKLIRDKVTGASLCYGFVDFMNPEHAGKSIQKYHTFEIDGKRLRVAYACAGAKTRHVSSNSGNGFPSMNGMGLSSGIGRFGTSSSSMLGQHHVGMGSGDVLGWEVCVMGVPMSWSETDLMTWFKTFGNLVSVRLFPHVSMDGSSGGGSPGLGGDVSPTSSQTLTATLIYEDQTSADQAATRMNGMQRPEWAQPLMVKVIGSVTSPGSAIRPGTSGLGMLSSDLSLLDSHFSGLLDNSGMNMGNDVGRRVARGLSGTMGGSGDPMESPTGCMSSANTDFSLMNSFNDPFSNMMSGIGGGSSSMIGGAQNGGAPPVRGGRPIVKNKMNGVNNSRMMPVTSPAEETSMHQQSMGGYSGRPITSGVSHPAALDDLTTDFSMLMSSKAMLNSGVNEADQRSWMLGGISSSPVGTSSGIHVRTALVQSTSMSAALGGGGRKVYLKLENTQPSGSFKLRGIGLFCKKAFLRGYTRIISSSGGNAGLAAAYACAQLGLSLTVVLPETTPASMRRLIEAEGANVLVHGANFEEAHTKAEELNLTLNNASIETDRCIVLHPYDHVDLWEGYETIVEELMADLPQAPDVIVLAVGGGGLMHGVVQGLWRNNWTNTAVVAMETEGADCLNQSVAAKRLVRISEIKSLATSLGAPSLGNRTWAMLQNSPVYPMTCTDSEAVTAVGRFLDDHGMLVEPACGAALSAVYTGALERLLAEGRLTRLNSVVVIVCGGRGVSRDLLGQWERRLGLARSPSVDPVQAKVEDDDDKLNETLKEEEEPAEKEGATGEQADVAE